MSPEYNEVFQLRLMRLMVDLRLIVIFVDLRSLFMSYISVI